MKTLIDVVAVFAFFGGLVFLATYALVAPWWRSREGLNLMVFTGAVTGLIGLRCLVLIFGDGYWGQDPLRLVMFVAVAAAGWHRWVRLVQLQVRPFLLSEEPNKTTEESQ